MIPTCEHCKAEADEVLSVGPVDVYVIEEGANPYETSMTLCDDCARRGLHGLPESRPVRTIFTN